MKTKNMKKAFTLIELLVVVVIIGLIAAAAMVTLKDTAEVKALQYTKKVMTAMKNAVAQKEEGRVFTGFLNDFGTMPPNAHFLLNMENNRTNFINGEPLGKFRIVNLHDRNDSHPNQIPMPFLDAYNAPDYNDTRLNSELKTAAMYIGHHGGYIGEGMDGLKDRSIMDGWSKVIKLVPDLNISEENNNSFLTITSAGSDGRFADDGASFIKDEFNEFNNTGNIKEFYAEDYNRTFARTAFLPKNMIINLTLELDTLKKAKVLIYSPMLYYVNGSANVPACTEVNTTHSSCGEYIPYIPHISGVTATYPNPKYNTAQDANVSWHVGIIKYELHFEGLSSGSTVSGKLSINNKEYNLDGITNDLNKSTFFKSLKFFDDNNSALNKELSVGNGDESNPFYITAGEKEIVILTSTNGTAWSYDGSCSKLFMPGENIEIVYENGECK